MGDMQPRNIDPKINLLRYMDRVQGIMNGNYKPPILADVDVIEGLCNLDCEWCCQRDSRESKNYKLMKPETMERMGQFCRDWGVKSWRIAGDSEPTMNKNLGVLLQSGYNAGMDMGLITNGTLLHKVSNLEYLTWIGVSLDASTPETWSRIKHSPEKNFMQIMENVRTIRAQHPTVEVTLKYTRWSSAHDIGKPELSMKGESGITDDNYRDAELLPALAEELGVKHSIHDGFPKNPQYKFKTCRATPLYAVFGADHKFYICCDRRVGSVLTDDYTRDDWKELGKLWGSDKHKEIIAGIVPKECPFCSKAWLNTIMENIIGDGEHTDEYQVNFI